MNLSEYVALKLFSKRMETLKDSVREVYKAKLTERVGIILAEKKKSKTVVPRTEFADVEDINDGDIVKTEGNFFILRDKNRYMIFRRRETVLVDDSVLSDIKKLALRSDTFEESITDEDRENRPSEIEEDRMLLEMMDDREIIVRKTLSKTDFQKLFTSEIKIDPKLTEAFISFFEENFPDEINPDKPTTATQKNIKMLDIEDLFNIDREHGRGVISAYQDEGYIMTSKEEYRINSDIKKEPEALLADITEDFHIKLQKYEANYVSLGEEFEEDDNVDIISLCKRVVFLYKKVETDLIGMEPEFFLEENKGKGYLNKIVKSTFEYENMEKDFTVPSFDLRKFKKEALGLGVGGERGYGTTDYGIVDNMEKARLIAKTMYNMERDSMDKQLKSPNIIRF